MKNLLVDGALNKNSQNGIFDNQDLIEGRNT